MEVIIRSVEEQDFKVIVSLIREFSMFQGTPEKVTITPEQMLKDKALFQCFVAEEKGKGIIGCATYFFAYFSWTGKALYLDDLYVKEEFRKRGVGKRLLETVLDFAEGEGCKKVRWQVSRWNTNAINFYESMGAVVDKTEMNCEFILMLAKFGKAACKGGIQLVYITLCPS